MKSGFINVLKPTGMTSADVVFAVKKKLKLKKIGHLGTLDPSASGVLPIALGKATKFFDYFLNKDKTYIARVKFGVETDTLDSCGKILSTNSKLISRNDLELKISDFMGTIPQIPPKYSAIKIGGKRACDLARENIDFEIKPKNINIYSIEILDELSDNEFLFKVHCSAGTYIRTLFADLANSLETVATTTTIIRISSGRFLIKDAVILDEISDSSIVSIEDAFLNVPKIEVNDMLAKKLINGVKIDASELKTLKNNEFFITFKKKIIGFYNIVDDKLNTVVYLYEVNDD